MTELESKIKELELKALQVLEAKEQTEIELKKLKELKQPTMSELFISLSEIKELVNYTGKDFNIEVKEKDTYAPAGDNFAMKFGKVVKVSHSVYLDSNQKNIVNQYLSSLGSFDNLQFIQI